MTKAELIEKLHKGAGKPLSKKALGILLDEVFDNISRSVKREKRFRVSRLRHVLRAQTQGAHRSQPAHR